jgi:hypothetical protein
MITHLLRPTNMNPPPPRPQCHRTDKGNESLPCTPAKAQSVSKEATQDNNTIHTPSSPAHILTPQTDRQITNNMTPPLITTDTRKWPVRKPAHILIAQISRAISGSWMGKQDSRDNITNLPDKHHAVNAILMIKRNRKKKKKKDTAKEDDKHALEVQPPIHITTNTEYTPQTRCFNTVAIQHTNKGTGRRNNSNRCKRRGHKIHPQL